MVMLQDVRRDHSESGKVTQGHAALVLVLARSSFSSQHFSQRLSLSLQENASAFTLRQLVTLKAQLRLLQLLERRVLAGQQRSAVAADYWWAGLSAQRSLLRKRIEASSCCVPAQNRFCSMQGISHAPSSVPPLCQP